MPHPILKKKYGATPAWVVCKLRRKRWQLCSAQPISALPTSSGRKALPTPSLKKGDHPLPPP